MVRRRLTRKAVKPAGPKNYAGKGGPRGPSRGPKATMNPLSRGKRGKQLSRAVPGPGKSMAAGASYYKKNNAGSTPKTVSYKQTVLSVAKSTSAFPGFNPNAGSGRNK